ncbi:MAG: glycerol-3-phosphate dehydrogenase/oxidase [Vicinamibacterales bacterium]
MVAQLAGHDDPWDFVVIGGGATGVGIAVDAASRGYSVLLLEQSDFGKGTSSRSTKLVHGGVRYLEQGNLSLVIGALKERGIMRANAPHLVHPLAFLVPAYLWWERAFYGVGLLTYSLLAGKRGFGRSAILSRHAALEQVPTLRATGLRGAVRYYDGQFDDARLLINLVQTAAEHGAVLVNYAQVTTVTRGTGGSVDGVVVRDLESGLEHRASARVVINATGPFSDGVRRMADARATPLVAASQGIHLVFDRSFLPGTSAVMVPHTADGRVMFAIPWHGHTLVGTTDTPIEQAALEPRPMSTEIDFVLETAAQYLAKAPQRRDVLSAFAGIRPLVRSGDNRITAALSRDHTIHVDPSGLLTITGGKWTTYRHMAEDTVDQAALQAHLPKKRCVTRTLRVHGATEDRPASGSLAVYGTDAAEIAAIMRIEPELAQPLHPDLSVTGAEIVWAARAEMARTLEDVLSRRSRALLLNARAAIAMAPRAVALLARELGRDAEWQRDEVERFTLLAQGYLVEA